MRFYNYFFYDIEFRRIILYLFVVVFVVCCLLDISFDFFYGIYTLIMFYTYNKEIIEEYDQSRDEEMMRKYVLKKYKWLI